MSEQKNWLDQPQAVRDGEQLPPEFFDYMKATFGVTTVSIKQFPSGFSNLTYLLDLDGRKLVLRRPPFGTKAKSAHDMGREFKVLSCLKAGGFPYSPDPVHYCDDPEVMGAPFYLMSHINGVILRQTVPEGLQLSDAQWRQQLLATIELQAQLHKMDYEALGLAEIGRPDGYAKRQVEGWIKRYQAARTEDAPEFTDICLWLSDELPTTSSKASLIHNDFKLDNIVFDPADPTRIIGLLDWEMTTIGEPLMDFGNSLAYWVEPKDPPYRQVFRTLPSHLSAYPSRAEQIAYYHEVSGFDVGQMNYYYTFGLFRLAVIAQQIYYRFFHGQTKDPRFGQLIHGVKGLEKACLDVISTGNI